MRLATSLSCCLAVALLATSCQHRFHGWPAFGPFNLFPNGVPFSLKGPPPTVFRFDGKQTPDLSGVNQDYFFPANPERILVADDAYRAGLFDPKNHHFKPTPARHAPSPDGGHTLETHTELAGGSPRHILRVSDRFDTVLQNRWSPGIFTGVFWSPDGKIYGFNERHPDKGDRQALQLYVLESGDEVIVDLRIDSLHGFFEPDELARRESISLRRWLTASQCIIWVHGPFEGPLSNPRWGYEVLVDLSVPIPFPNARILRAFVRPQSVLE